VTEEVFSFESALEWTLAGTPDMLKLLLKRVADEFRFGAYIFRAEEPQLRSGLSALRIRADAPAGGEPIGYIHCEQLPGQRTRMRVPPGRGSRSPTAWSLDRDGTLFSAFLRAALSELRKSGFLASSSRFQSHAALVTARRELDAAEDSAAFAAIGNICRSAMVALANELYAPHMLPSGQDEPKGDDVRRKLKLVLSHHFGGRSEHYLRGLEKNIEGCWEIVTSLYKRKTATREEAEACFSLVAGLFEAFSFIVPP
jgi:hypothetical protein